LDGVKDGVDALNFLEANTVVESLVLKEDGAAPAASPEEGTKMGISLSFGDNVANLLVIASTEGWNSGVFMLNFLLGSLLSDGFWDDAAVESTGSADEDDVKVALVTEFPDADFKDEFLEAFWCWPA